MTLEQIKELLPHREPFLFVDQVTKIDKNTVEAFRDIQPDEYFFAGHFPGFPVLPGVLMVEAIAQVGILIVLNRLGGRGSKKTLFARIDQARFKRQVNPGDRLLLRAEVVGSKAGVYKIRGTARVGEELACEATVVGALRD
ncbi:MAG: 3-hydroxyacyl-ACP dehydratase FabZ [candidate division WOR-3 bacterium]|nr:MAG: 3-hydroxyacyl-ACP dehydratase FabZ [candidate division WOR-3 bacterium]